MLNYILNLVLVFGVGSMFFLPACIFEYVAETREMKKNRKQALKKVREICKK